MNSQSGLALQALILFLFAALLSGCGELAYTNIDNAQLQEMLDKDVPVYDIRRPEEWKQTGVVRGSKLMTFVDKHGRVKPAFFERFSKTVSKGDPVILICRTGNRTGTLARILSEKMGYTRVYNVRNGITRWIGDKHPVQRL